MSVNNLSIFEHSSHFLFFLLPTALPIWNVLFGCGKYLSSTLPVLDFLFLDPILLFFLVNFLNLLKDIFQELPKKGVHGKNFFKLLK